MIASMLLYGIKEAAYDSMKQQQYDELNKYGELKSFGANAIQN